VKRKGDKKQTNKKIIFTDECTPMHTQSHNEIINFTGVERTLKLMYVCLTMQMFI